MPSCLCEGKRGGTVPPRRPAEQLTAAQTARCRCRAQPCRTVKPIFAPLSALSLLPPPHQLSDSYRAPLSPPAVFRLPLLFAFGSFARVPVAATPLRRVGSRTKPTRSPHLALAHRSGILQACSTASAPLPAFNSSVWRISQGERTSTQYGHRSALACSPQAQRQERTARGRRTAHGVQPCPHLAPRGAHPPPERP